MYYDDYDHHPDGGHSARADLLPSRPVWPRFVSAALFGVLAVLHACA